MNELEAVLKPLIEEYCEQILDVAKEDAQRYAKEMAEDFAKYLYRFYAENDEVAKENLKDLRAQARLLAIKHRILTQRATVEMLVKAMEILARVGLAALKVNLPTP